VIEKTAESVKKDKHLLNIMDNILLLMMEEIDNTLRQVTAG